MIEALLIAGFGRRPDRGQPVDAFAIIMIVLIALFLWAVLAL